jgi:hypothetical protein
MVNCYLGFHECRNVSTGLTAENALKFFFLSSSSLFIFISFFIASTVSSLSFPHQRRTAAGQCSRHNIPDTWCSPPWTTCWNP